MKTVNLMFWHDVNRGDGLRVWSCINDSGWILATTERLKEALFNRQMIVLDSDLETDRLKVN